MRFFFLALTLVCCGAANAQNTRGYIFFAPGAESAQGDSGGSVHAYGMGGGGELLLSPHFGVGAEIGAFVPGAGKVSNGVVGIFSTNGYAHILRDRAFDPYITGGYSLLFRDFTANGGNFGVGANYWFHERLGLLIEGRDHVATVHNTSNHFWEIRIGLTFQ
jgi:hypothetical protein